MRIPNGAHQRCADKKNPPTQHVSGFFHSAFSFAAVSTAAALTQAKTVRPAHQWPITQLLELRLLQLQEQQRLLPEQGSVQTNA